MEKSAKDTSVLLRKLNDRIAKEQELYNKQSYEDRIRLSKKLYFSSQRAQVRILRRIEAIKTAIEVLEKRLPNVDVATAVYNCLSPHREDFDDLAYKARSEFLCERAKALKVIFEDILPICRKEMLREIEHYLPQTTTTPCNPSSPTPSAGTTAATTTGETAPVC